MAHTFLLVHGAWTGGWCWDSLRPLLEDRGHTVLAPDMPGHGADPSPIGEQTLETCARSLEALLEPLREPVILVGHSFGGMVISQAASCVPDKIKQLVYVAAFLPRDGESCNGITKGLRPTFREKLQALGDDFILSGDGKTSELTPNTCAGFVFSDILREQALLMAERLGPESNASQQQPVQLNDRFRSIQKTYIRCAYDRTVDIRLQDNMIATAGCERVYTLQTGHCPFASDPRGLANILLNL